MYEVIVKDLDTGEITNKATGDYILAAAAVLHGVKSVKELFKNPFDDVDVISVGLQNPLLTVVIAREIYDRAYGRAEEELKKVMGKNEIQ